jgi:hypothetical protein
MPRRCKSLIAVLCALVAGGGAGATTAWAGGHSHQRAGTLRLDPANPHYFRFHGETTPLVTSGEHYGAVLNRDFDYVPYLDELERHGLNLTRIFSGSYRELPGEFAGVGLPENTLGPRPGRFLAPWARSDTPGYAHGGNKFDLTKWDPAYFHRLKDLVAQADRRGIAVEVVLFCFMYSNSQWALSPMNAANNVNGIGAVDDAHVHTLDNPGLLAVQDALTRKIVSELRDFDNVYYEIINEPYADPARPTPQAWQDHIASTIAATEAPLPRKHLIAQNYANGSVDPNPLVSVLNFHYASPPTVVAQNYGLNRVIAFDETGWAGVSDDTYRHQAWDFMTAGGGVFDNLDFSFTVDDERGLHTLPTPDACCPGSPTLRRQLGFLKGVLDGLPLAAMHPGDSVVQSATTGASTRALIADGDAYAVYVTAAAPQRTELALRIPRGTYRVRWLDPEATRTLTSRTIKHRGGTFIVQTPGDTDEAGLVIRRVGGGHG